MGDIWECEHGVHRSEPCADCFRERASAEDEAAMEQAQAEIASLRQQIQAAREELEQERAGYATANRIAAALRQRKGA